MKKPFIHILNSDTLNTKAGFKLIYKTMLSTKDFHKAISIIIGVRKYNIICAQIMINGLKARYDKEQHDYVHAVSNNNSINN